MQLHSKSGLFISKTYAYSTFILIIFLNFITFHKRKNSSKLIGDKFLIFFLSYRSFFDNLPSVVFCMKARHLMLSSKLKSLFYIHFKLHAYAILAFFY